ncbi:MAG: trigger factor [Candidatus Saccharimonadales bacterium]
MQTTIETINPTKLKLAIVTDAAQLASVKHDVLTLLSRNVRVPGFRAGKAPQAMVEKQIDPSLLQSEFLEQAVNRAYVQALQTEKIRPASQPQISISKYVPYDTLEFTAELEAVGEIKLADYKKIKLAIKPVKITKAQIDAVLSDLQGRVAEKQDVDRAVKSGDQATIDFAGVDAKTKEPIQGGDGQAYPLLVGSNSFIPGFEDNIVGMKPGDDKDFTIAFPADYGVQALQKRQVIFSVTVKSVQAVKPPKLDDSFAATVGPFKTVDELTADIKQQLTFEAEGQNRRNFENELIEMIAAKSTVAVPDVMIDDEITRLEEEEKRNLVYRGQTWQEHLDIEGHTEEEHRAKNREPAEQRVKAGIVLGEIADIENINVSLEELEQRILQLKAQYKDQAMQTELDKPENRRDVTSRILSEKTIQLLTSYASS